MSITSKSVKDYSTFDPRYIPGCTLWLDGDDSSTITFSSGSSVQTWRDKSSSANNATGATVKPTYPVVVSGRNTLAFDSNSGSYMTLDASKLPTGTSSFSAFTVSKANSGNINSYPYIFSWGDFSAGATNTYSILYAQVNPTTYYLGTTITNSTILSNYDTTNVFNTLCIFSNQSTSSSETDFITGKLFSNITARSAYNISTSYGVIGAAANSSFSGKLTGNIGEIIVFNRSITNTERQQVEGYLAWKWALQTNLPTIPAHPYRSSIKRGPVLSTFNPTDISGCACWIDASDRSTIYFSSGSTVNAVDDKSPNPAYGTNVYGTLTWTYNGLDGVRPAFGTTSGALVLDLSVALFDFTNTTFIVSSYSSAPNNGNAAVAFATSGQGSTTFYRALDYTTSSPTRFRTIAFFGSIYQTTTALGPAANNTPFLFSSSFTGSTPINNYYNAGTQTATVAAASPSTYATHVMIGCDGFTFANPTTPAQYWTNGQISEVLVFDRVLTDTERYTIDSYLSYKWGIQSNMPANHPYKNYYPLKIN